MYVCLFIFLSFKETAMISITEEATINTKEDVSSFMFRLHFTLEPTSRLCKEWFLLLQVNVIFISSINVVHGLILL